MDPVALAMLWMERHPAETAYTQASRQAFQKVHGPISQADWNSAVGRVVFERRAGAAVLGAHGNQYLRNALAGLVAAGRNVIVRVYVTGTDVGGFRATSIIDVPLGPNDRRADVIAAAIAAAGMDNTLGGLQIDGAEIVGVQVV